jgi:hypothetical protein
MIGENQLSVRPEVSSRQLDLGPVTIAQCVYVGVVSVSGGVISSLVREFHDYLSEIPRILLSGDISAIFEGFQRTGDRTFSVTQLVDEFVAGEFATGCIEFSEDIPGTGWEVLKRGVGVLP